MKCCYLEQSAEDQQGDAEAQQWLHDAGEGKHSGRFSTSVDLSGPRIFLETQKKKKIIKLFLFSLLPLLRPTVATSGGFKVREGETFSR